jgi:hypothetical protein
VGFVIFDHSFVIYLVNAKTLDMPEEKYTVWAGGVEVNDHLLTKSQAEDLAQEYIDDDYDDVIVEKVEE